MASSDSPSRRGIVLRIKNAEYRIGPKWIFVLILAAVIIILSILASPTNGWIGVGVGISGICGAVLGLLIQPEQLPRDWSLEAKSAVRGLLDNADSVENVARLTTQLASNTVDGRVAVGLVTAQDELLSIREKMFLSMAEWDAVAPGATDEVSRLQDAGREALDRLRSQPNVQRD